MHNTKATVFYIVRHGETIWNVKRKLQGHFDSSLTELGLSQAKSLGKKKKNIHFDAVFSSDLIRAKHTAEIITLERKMAVQTTKLLRERSFGSLEGKSYKIFEKELKSMVDKFEKLTDKEKKSFKFSKEMESDEELVGRFITFLREVALAYSGKTILVVSHGGMMRSLLIHLGFGSYKTVPPGAVSNSGYIKLVSDGIEFEIKETEGIMKILNE